jgi:alcohol dehydrogenase
LFSRESWKLAESSLDTVISEPQNLHARGQMLLASAYGGTAIAQSMLGAVHSAANPLTAHFNIVHGQAVGIMLPHVIRFNSRDPQAMAHYVDLAATAGLARRGDDPEQSLSTILARIVALLAAAEIPDSLKDCGVPRDKLSSLAEEASRQWTATFNPAKISAADFKALYEAAWESRRQTLKIPAGAASERKDDA